jgi:hypothetical protein
MIKKYISTFAVALILMSVTHAQNPLAINSTNVAISQNFDLLGRSVTIDSILVPGWQFLEGGTGAVNRTYGVNDGASNTGNTYSYGTANSSDRAFGSVASGTLQSTIGAYYINKTGNTIIAVRLQFTMEQWRSGGRTSTDSSEFFYGINNGGFLSANGTWIKNRSLNLVSKIFGNPAPIAGSRIGNDTANQIQYDVTISSLTLNDGDTIYLRWRDQDAQGSDDGLAIDNFSITAFSGTLPTPNPVTTLAFTPNSTKTGSISFNRSGYNSATMTTLVFMKQGSAITQGTPVGAPENYNANSNFSQASSTYENDAQARCVYSGDALSIPISGLQTTTNYHLLVYVVRDADSVYSSAAITNSTTLGIPVAVTSTLFLGESQTSATISWVKPTEYVNVNYTTLVFVKEGDSAISSGSSSEPPTYYIANNNYMGNGTPFISDTLTKCVFKGDATSVTVTGLMRNQKYQYLIFSYREIDSLYAAPTLGSGKTLDKNVPSALNNITFSQITSTSGTINWAKAAGYSNDSMQVLIFMKALSPINDTTIHTIPASNYFANADFASTASTFEHDSTAKCVYNGDGSNVAISGLTPQITYNVIGYVINVFDTAYSNVRANTFTTPAPPVSAPTAVSAITITQTGLLNARISWTKPTGYINNTHTTLVFVKKSASILDTGTINRSPIRYTPSINVGNGTKYDFDTLAYCVFRADTNFVAITNLNSNGLFSIVIHILRDADSVASPAAVATLNMQIPTLRNIGSINKPNLTTGLPDSNGLFVQISGTVVGFNQRLSGLQFLLSDKSGGITAFNLNRNFAYTVNEGDSVHAIGVVGSNRGLCILTLDTLWSVIRNPINIPFSVASDLNEETENKLVQITSAVRFLNTPIGSNWPINTTNIQVVNEVQDTFVIRLLSFSNLAGKPLPTSSTFIVTGMGGQQSTNNFVPFAFNGYYIIPRSENDITNGGELGIFNLITPAADEIITLSEPLTDTIVFSWNSSLLTGPINEPVYRVEFDTITGDFSNPLGVFESDNTGSDTIFTTDKASILDFLLMLSYTPGQRVYGKWRVVATSGLVIKNSLQSQHIEIVIPFPTNLNENNFENTLSIFPNPASHFIHIQSAEDIEEVSIYSITGVCIKTYKPNVIMTIDDIPKGIYLIHITGNDGQKATRKLIVN